MTIKRLEIYTLLPQLYQFFKEIEPKIKKNGHYYNSKTKECWIEKDGHAFDNPKGIDYFKHCLKMEENCIRDCELEALKVLKSGKLLSKQLSDLLYFEELRRKKLADRLERKRFLKHMYKNLLDQ